ncbi:MAG: LrgB family protein [Acutalibacteraceae bacterium]|nr:LrgB family protein [Acutalibacteraceae bacterium]
MAYSIYLQLKVLKKYWLPILVGCLTSCIVSIGSTIGLCKLFGLDNTLTNSLIPRSVTTPIAMSVSEKLGGISGITVAAVIITGIFGAVAAPLLAKLLHIKNPVGVGVGLGCSCHAIGTARALELGEIQGAMSSIALGVAGMMTVVISLFL